MRIRYFLFQAALIPCICLRNDPTAPEATDWRRQIGATLKTISGMAPFNASSSRCHRVIAELSGRYLDGTAGVPSKSQANTPADGTATATDGEAGHAATTATTTAQPLNDMPPYMADSQPVGESPETQINNVFSMMWPNVPPLEAADVVMGDDGGWMEFLRAGSAEDWETAFGGDLA